MTIRNLDPKAAHEAMSKDAGHAFVDVRSPQEYAAGHPRGAVNVPWALHDPATGGMAPNPNFLPAMQAQFKAARTIYVSCQSGVRSLHACKALEQAGYADLVNITTGFGGKRDPSGRVISPGWRDSNLPTD